MQNFSVLYENQDILAIHKPYGVSVQGGEKVGTALIDNIDKFFNQKHYLIHRLDKETEGILIVGKTSEAASRYSKILNNSESHKEYRVISFGVPQKKEGIIQNPIMSNGKELPAKTQYKLLSTNGSLSYISAKIFTGRKHQIRIHLAKNGLPIVCDKKYGDFEKNRNLKKTIPCKKLMLAAISLILPLPHEKLKLEIPLPTHMQELLQYITTNQQ